MDATEASKIKQRAKSRLKKSEAVKSRKINKNKQKNWRALAISCFSLVLLYFLISYLPPSAIKNFILPQSYLPFIFLSFFVIFFLFLFIFSQKRLSFLLSIAALAIIFLKLQNIKFNLMALFFILGINLISYLLIWLKQRLL